MTDHDIIQAALKAEICFPLCWNLSSSIFPEEDIRPEWSEAERKQMAKLRHFAELIKALPPAG